MEKLTDFTNNIKDRITNPLIFSYIFSWLIINWKITVALIWYDTEQIKDEGYKSIFDLIERSWLQDGAFYKPLIFAISYTLLFPILKGLIRLFNSVILKYTDKLDLKILKGSVVSMDKFLNFRELYLNKSEKLDEIIKVEDIFIKENNDIKDKLKKLEQNVHDMDNTRLLSGYWKVKYSESIDYLTGNPVPSTEMHVFISDSRFYEIKDGKRELKYIIDNFNYSVKNTKIIFVKVLLTDNIVSSETQYAEENLLNILRIKDMNIDKLIGLENGKGVEYERIDKIDSE